MAICMRAGELLKAWREVRGLTQAQAAEQLGLSQASFSDYERGRKSPDVVRALDIAKATQDSVPVQSWGEPAAHADESGPHPAVDAAKAV